MASTYINLPQVGLEDESLVALENITVTVNPSVEITNDVGNPIPVSGTVSITGVATEVTLQAVLTELGQKTEPTDTQPISAASLPLPTGAATAALQLPDNHQVSANQSGTWTVDIGGGMPQLVVENAIEDTAFNLQAGAYSETSAVVGDYILDHIQLNFSSTQSRDITITTNDGTKLWAVTGNTSRDIVLEDIDKAFNSGDQFTIAITQAAGACTLDVLATVRTGTVSLGSNSNAILYGTKNSGEIAAVPLDSRAHLEVSLQSPRLPFGALHTEKMTPIFQTDAVYGVTPNQTLTTLGINAPGSTSATVTGTNNLFTCSTGTTAYSFGVLQSRKRLRYRAGQGIIGRYTALFSTPAANSTTVAGFGTAESGFYFGYNGTSFGILYSTGGVREIQTLTVTTASTATNNYVVTLGGTAFNVTATNNGSTVKTAYEISKGTYAGWSAEQRGSTVVFVADSVGNKAGTFSLAQGGAGTPAAGTFVETLAGVASTDTWVPKANWNLDVCDGSNSSSNPSGFTLDPSKGNVYQLNVQYLGFGTITLKVEAIFSNGNNPEFIDVHTFNLPNTLTTVNISQPSFPFTMAAYSAGSTTNVSVSCASYAGFIEGDTQITGPRMSFNRETNNYVGSTAATYYPLFTIQNSYAHGQVAERANQAVVNLLSLSAAHDDATPLSFYLIRNATLVGTPNFTKYSTSSCLYWDTAATTCTVANLEQIVFNFVTGEVGGGAFTFEDIITIQPGESITLAARAVTGTATYVIASLNTREDQ